MREQLFKIRRSVNGRQCTVFGGKGAESCIICGMESHAEADMAETAGLLYEKLSPDACALVVFETDDWNGDFSPWQAAAVFGGEPFTGTAPATLEWLRESLLPYLEREGFLRADSKKYIAGYSLSGLFALWAFWESELFDGAASCSGSLWFPHWIQYMESRSRNREGIVYLSLGNREEKTKNRVMAAVGDNTRRTHQILRDCLFITKTALEWNEGGHFSHPTQRLVKGMLWLAEQGK